MRVEVSMTTAKQEFHVSSWWASCPEFVLGALTRQLEAAAAVWPDLAKAKLCENRNGHWRPLRDGSLSKEPSSREIPPSAVLSEP